MAKQFSISRNRPKRYYASLGPGATSEWYCKENAGLISDSIPSMVLSFRFRCVTLTFLGRDFSSTEKPWLWLVIFNFIDWKIYYNIFPEIEHESFTSINYVCRCMFYAYGNIHTLIFFSLFTKYTLSEQKLRVFHLKNWTKFFSTNQF